MTENKPMTAGDERNLRYSNLNNYLLRAIAAYDSRLDGRYLDVSMEDRSVEIAFTIRELKLLQSSLEWRMYSKENER